MERGIFILVMLTIVQLQGCGNQFFYYPSKADHINDNIRWLYSSSGNELAYLWLPTPAETVKGIVVHFHGNSGHMEVTQEKVSWLVDHGYHVFVYDYSGFGHSSGQATDQALYQDAMTVLAYVEVQQMSMGLPVFIVATSTGGNVFLRAWADQPINIAGLIIDSSFTSYIDTAEFTLNNSFLGKFYGWTAAIVLRDDYAAQLSLVDVPKTKTLVLHCLQDKVVPIAASEIIYSALDGEKEFWRLEGCNHARAMTAQFPDIQERIVTWLAKVAPISPSLPQDNEFREIAAHPIQRTYLKEWYPLFRGDLMPKWVR